MTHPDILPCHSVEFNSNCLKSNINEVIPLFLTFSAKDKSYHAKGYIVRFKSIK
jgi:hypothetical protein